MAENYQAFRDESGTYNEIVEIPTMLNLIGDVDCKTVLDAGCGNGYYSILLAKNRSIGLFEKSFSEIFRVLKPVGTSTFSGNHQILKGCWEKDREGRRLHWNMDNYFELSVGIDEWGTKDGRVIKTSYGIEQYRITLML